MELEIRQLRMQAMQAVLDSVVQQAMVTGSFEKILITQNQNLGLALDKGLVKQQPYITGLSGRAALDNDVRPIRALDYAQAHFGIDSGSRSGGVRGALAPLNGIQTDGLVEIAQARLKVAKVTQDLSAKEITLLSEMLAQEMEGVSYQTHPAQSGGNAL
jgi:hypothetical protein